MRQFHIKNYSTYFLFKRTKLVAILLLLVSSCMLLAKFTNAKSLFPSVLKVPEVIFSLFKFFMPNVESFKYLHDIANSYYRSSLVAISSTVLATFVALIFALLSANLTKRGFFLPIMIRFFASLCRNIPLPAWVILFLFSFGQNELTGFLVLFTVTLGTLTRIFRELIENTSNDSFIACTACGASYTSAIIHGILPNIEGQVISWLLYALATNIRDVALVGILTGSGIGFLFTLFFRSFRYEVAGLVIVVMTTTVIIFDLLSKKMRHFMLSSDALECSTKLKRYLSRVLFSFLLFVSILSLFFIKTDHNSIFKMLASLFENIKAMFFQIIPLSPMLKPSLLISCCLSIALAFLSTILSSLIAIPIAMLNTSFLFRTKAIGMVIEVFFSFMRSIPTIIWVMLFSVCLGVGATATIIGISLHSIAYLIYAFSMSFDSKSSNISTALTATGASAFVIFFKAVLPSSLKDILSWTFFRFEINFMNAVALGSAAGAGGIGYELFIAGSMEFDIQSVGTITYILLAVSLVLESISSQIKKRMQL